MREHVSRWLRHFPYDPSLRLLAELEPAERVRVEIGASAASLSRSSGSRGRGSPDLGSDGERLVLDLNFAYNPSCAYDARWACPLAPPANRLPLPLRAGELAYRSS